ncbi:hypothetical protein [Fibrobacter sp.]|uniref:hypothetical protein n=1 Tax=Fibrobacter sp. TaxID=35828 RepID=UPI0025C40E24|nr:hypothetical protein [Fibrobacter sp.]MBR3072724.1 hypothetical protein [Fibrobacter sp.]
MRTDEVSSIKTGESEANKPVLSLDLSEAQASPKGKTRNEMSVLAIWLPRYSTEASAGLKNSPMFERRENEWWILSCTLACCPKGKPGSERSETEAGAANLATPSISNAYKKIYAANSYVDFCCLGDMLLI